MPNILPEAISNYAERYSQHEPEILKELNRETYAKILMPQMLSGHLQGRFLSMMSKMIRPKKVLEIGTYTGYSAICIAEGLDADGVVDTIDINEELEEMVANFIDKSGYKGQIVQHIGNALEIIPTLDGPFDLVFIDADKVNYAKYYDQVFDKVKEGGFIMADNVLWSGKVVEEEKDKDTAALHEYNEKISSDIRVEAFLAPIRDGIMVARKIV